MKKFFVFLILSIITTISLLSCSTVPKGAVIVTSFDKGRYLGKWYEIARMDFRFERNLNNTTAIYSLEQDGKIKVINGGFNYVTNKWTQAEGKAKFAGAPDEAKLKVSFFGPFFSPYNVIALDSEYKYALIAGKNLKYLWILSRETEIPDEIKQKYLKIAREIGFNVSELIWVEHDKKSGN
jgi:apolipoprotein D and lipocalin family protein